MKKLLIIIALSLIACEAELNNDEVYALTRECNAYFLDAEPKYSMKWNGAKYVYDIMCVPRRTYVTAPN